MLENAFKKPGEMTFGQFASAMMPSGAVNRFPKVGAVSDVYTYSVYMNGPLATLLPKHAQQHEFKDLPLHALTEKLGLNKANARDNLKVGEMLGLRSSWQMAVLEHSMGNQLSDAVHNDYALLADGLDHPWIQAELEKQKGLQSKLQPALLLAGIPKDIIPNEISVGKIVARDSNFTFQKTTDGEVVTHENRRLAGEPQIGIETTVSYYRGTGQVVPSLEKLKVSEPFIDPVSSDLAIMIEDGKGLEQVVMFNSMASFGKFVAVHGLDKSMVEKAIKAREESPELDTVGSRKVLREPFHDKATDCIVVEYEERGAKYSAMVRNADELASMAKEFNLSAFDIAVAQKIDEQRFGKLDMDQIKNITRSTTELSELELRKALKTLDVNMSNIGTPENGRVYLGPMIAKSDFHVAQSIGRGNVVIYDVRNLDKAVERDEVANIHYEANRGRVTVIEKQGVGKGGVGR